MSVLYGVSTLVFLLALSIAGAAAPRATPSPSKPKTPASSRQSAKRVSYENDVRPILRARCYACHGDGSKLGEFQIDSREGILTGGKTHPVVQIGNGAGSYLIKLVSGDVPGKVMPPSGPRLTKQEIATLRAWIDQGMRFGETRTASVWRPPLRPRRPALPLARPGLAHPIDRLLHPYFRAHKITPRPAVDDRTFARRVYLDIIGLLPTPAQLRAFETDRAVDKRARLARRLLADNRNYTEHWLTFWNDLLRNDYAGTGYIDGGRTQITGWLYNALMTNLPYDRFVSQLVNPIPESAGFVKGIVWRGVVNASQTPEMQAAQNISQVFLGVNLKCASCHDSFIDNWKLADAYGMAAIYAAEPEKLEMVRCDKPQGTVAPVKFLYPELGAIDGSAPREKRLAQLAAVLTSKANGRLARTFVNRLWARVMGRGLIEPADAMDSRPWNPDLLDWLAADFADNGYDAKKLIERIVTSRAYQMPAVGQKNERGENHVFAGPVVKRLSAEQFSDAVSSVTGVWPAPASQFSISKGQVILPPIHRARIAFESGLMRSGAVDIDIDITGAQVLALVVTDGGNGANHDWADWADARLVGARGEIKLTDLKWYTATTGYAQIQIDRNIVEKPLRIGDRAFTSGIGTHANSVITYLLPPGVTRFRATAGPDRGAVEAGPQEVSLRLFVITGDRSLLESRAALALSNPLTRALGRPNREQVVTQRTTAATTIQALEITNGQTLAALLTKGAARWTVNTRTSPAELVAALYEHALGRLPTPPERRTALALVGSPVRKEGVEDLLWALTMLPEFQLIY